jgi:xanthine dehydrogenase YagS FAD-binding subunit
MIADLPNNGLRLGALARMRDVAWDARVRERYPVVSQALLLAASGQLRNMATIGGNVLQRTRCPYFRDTAMPCNKRVPGTGCSAIAGINRTEAVLGTSDHCIATYPGDLAVALVALDATVTLRGASGERIIPFGSLHVLPGSHPDRETTLQPGELITFIDLPPIPAARRSLYLKVRDRASFAFALASAAVALEVEDGTIRDARVGLGGVAAKPWRSTEAEHALVGKHPSEQTFRAAADAALSKAKPRRDNAFKVLLAKRTLVRALTEVTA